MVIESMPCLSGGRLKEPIRLPTKVVDAQLLVRFGSKEPWPFQLLAGRVDLGPSLNAANGRVGATIAKLMEVAAGEQRIEASRDAAGIVEAATAGRSKLGLGDSSGEEEVAASPTGAASPKRRGRVPHGEARCRPSEPKATARIVTITLQGQELAVCKLNQQLWLSCAPAALQAVCDEMREEFAPKAVTKARARAQARLRPSHCDAGSTSGRLRWEPSHGRFCITYRTAEGRRLQCRRGLSVSETGIMGEPLPQEEYKAEYVRKLLLAKARWNELDQSGAQKFVLA